MTKNKTPLYVWPLLVLALPIASPPAIMCTVVASVTLGVVLVKNNLSSPSISASTTELLE